ncbi:TaqI-like C-terminal specificity domain-containing protein [Flavobacterium omnivorum]|uniref:site-specific DNA-methyltransferase (adenine-specific) n=1 Tax=Flavobacterium omnivorum TaxID=178355 RepID=A0A1G8G3Y4_9FLAO|nr:N-6 DNA methylase [Flavobacterium omnivorum]SDH88990.1 TaqI-like C-terminal specificity domain-containing protein [Flavobacterium omnivorum]
MALYQKSVLNKHLKQLEQPKVSKAYKKYVKYFLNPTIQDNIRNSKEEEYQGIFLTELFVNVLDYTLKPNVDFNLVAEYKNQSNSRKADGAILSNNVAIGVIELKGTKTKDLESIRQQAFDYKANQKECVYVITSNYEKLRFYINDATEFEEFNLFELTEERFELLYLCLQKDNILNNIPLKTKEASIAVEEQITKQFYKDYSIFKRELFRDLVKRNAKRLKSTLSPTDVEIDEDSKADQSSLDKNLKLALFKKSQKLIDRFLFVFFAEDRGLLPPNSTIQILNKWKSDVDFGDERPLYDMFKQYFRFLDTGRQGTTNRAEIYAYNGGLFKEDSLLDKLEIDNELLFKHTQILASYDFESQVDVNILGHIFENSLNEIESVNAEIEGGDFDKQKSKRKKDGVFYTPKYITKYIVENTIGKLCEEKKIELGFKEEEYFKGRKNRQQATIVKLVEILDTYRDWLLQLTICDPACGSGAFLNQALDFLIKEHNYIDELKAKILGGGLVFSDIENTILEKNIYGVDLNEESVEIAKLSLWLRTAQPRRKLNSLNNNIKCGNSLIDSKTVAGDKAFNWQEQFPAVFAKGGFDVIIGNPPYVNVELIPLQEKEFYKKKYEAFYKRSDLFVLFIDLAISKLTINGMVSLIIPSVVLNNLSYKLIRDKLLNNKWLSEICYTGGKVFADATVDTVILTINKKEIKEIKLVDAINFNNHIVQTVDTSYFKKYQNAISIGSNGNDDLYEKLFNTKFVKVEDYFNVFQGIVTGNNTSYIFENDEDVKKANIDEELLKPIVLGRDIGKWVIRDDSKKILYLNNEIDIQNYSLTKKWLLPFKNKLEKRRECLSGVIPWYSLQWPRYKSELDKVPKILLQRTRNESLKTRLVATIDEDGVYGMESIIFLTPLSNEISVYYFLAILNSKLLNYLFATKFLNLSVKGDYLKQIRFPKSDNVEILDKFSTIMIKSYKELSVLNTKFTKYLQSQFATEKLTKKLENWYELDFGDFIKEINKAIKVTNKERVKNELQAIRELTKLDEMDWMDVFETKKAEAQALKQQIGTTDREIDAMVYELYGLTEEEIAIVENN